MIGSVLFQTYENWELCLSDGSDENHSYIEKVCREIAESNSGTLIEVKTGSIFRSSITSIDRSSTGSAGFKKC